MVDSTDSAFKGLATDYTGTKYPTNDYFMGGYKPQLTSSGYYQYYTPQQQDSQEKGGSSFDFSNLPTGSSGSGFGSGITSAIDKFGSNYLGLGSGNVNYGVSFGPQMPGSAAMQGPSQALSGTAVEGSLGTSATLSGILGSAATGAAIGGFLNKKNPTAGMIGGAVGGVAGGMMIGAQIGSVVPGIGTVIGAVVGGLGSRLFGGGKPATNAVVSAGNISPDGKISNIRVTGSKNPGQFAEFGNENVNAMQNITTAAARDLGIKFSPFQVESGISTRHGGAYMRIEGQNPQGITVNDTGQMFYDYTNKDSTKDLQYKALEALAKNSGYTDTAKLKEWFDSGSSTNFASGAGNTLKLAKPKENTSFKDFVANFKSTQNANAA